MLTDCDLVDAYLTTVANMENCYVIVIRIQRNP